jgi:hypothetical protein
VDGDSANMPALKKQRGRRKMEFFAGLDVSLAQTLLIQRRNLKRKFLDIENSIRHSLRPT